MMGSNHRAETTERNDDGIVPRLVADLFAAIDKSDAAIEFTVRLSVVEIYLDRIRDLLVPAAPKSPTTTTRHNTNNNTNGPPPPPVVAAGGALQGCARWSCTSAADAIGMIQRATVVRTCSHRDFNRDANRSSLVVQLEMEQYCHNNRTSSTVVSSTCRFFDLLGSELASPPGDESSSATEPAAVLVSQSLQYLHRYVTEQRQGIPVTVATTAPALCQLLANAMGGNSYCTLLLTASPTSWAVQETIRTLKFGLDCRDLVCKPVPNVQPRWTDGGGAQQQQQQQALERQMRFEDLAVALAVECKRLQQHAVGDGGGGRITKTLDVIVDQILECEKHDRPLRFTIETQLEHETKKEQMRLKAEARRAMQERNEALALVTQLRSDVAIWQSQFSSLRDHLSHVQEELAVTKNETLVLQQRKQEVEHNLRTSLFRESEAVVFLRQLRRFYYRLLRKMAAEGTGDVGHILSQIPGAPDLTQLVDIDHAMIESGLLEQDEVGGDVSTTYRPSRSALLRSTSASEKAVARSGHGEFLDVNQRTTVISDAAPPPISIVRRRESPLVVEARQRLYGTPSGKYIAMRETVLEEEILELSERCVQLRNQLEEEKSNVEALTGRTGVGGAFDRMRAANETRALKEQLEKKDNDLNAVIWKMNELHLSGKTIKAESTNKDHHVAYLEEHLENLETKAGILLSEKEETEKKLREEMKVLQSRLDNISVPAWHLSDTSTTTKVPMQCRLVVPFTSSVHNGNDLVRRTSNGSEGEWTDLNLLAQSTCERIDAETQTDGDPFDDCSVMSIEVKKTPAENFLFMDDSSEGDCEVSHIVSIPSRQNSSASARQFGVSSDHSLTSRQGIVPSKSQSSLTRSFVAPPSTTSVHETEHLVAHSPEVPTRQTGSSSHPVAGQRMSTATEKPLPTIHYGAQTGDRGAMYGKADDKVSTAAESQALPIFVASSNNRSTEEKVSPKREVGSRFFGGRFSAATAGQKTSPAVWKEPGTPRQMKVDPT
jgi:predicted  nucleic acid-binding Zn-ribbon protein